MHRRKPRRKRRGDTTSDVLSSRKRRMARALRREAQAMDDDYDWEQDDMQ